MMLPPDFLQTISKRREKVIVGGQNMPLGIKLNGRLSAINQIGDDLACLDFGTFILRLSLEKQCQTPQFSTGCQPAG
ncbi:hypothetical protein [Pseudophaeobacter profundi]|uniref:hypothetical protein n=1 Tax=Pseudophaeobacter profundi TaxID=3034152 RepID=UPI0024324969|nr:hypothetical protein [Pseudophaeobacter profundi]